MFQSLFLLPKADLRKVDFLHQPCSSSRWTVVPYFRQKTNLCFIPPPCALCCRLGLHNIEFQFNNAPAAGHEKEVLTNFLRFFLFWVNYHVIVVCWIIFFQRKTIIIILTISSWCLLLGWKYDVMMIKLFPTWRLFLEFGPWLRSFQIS